MEDGSQSGIHIMATNDAHTSRRFDAELDSVKGRIMQMGTQVREQFRLAMACVGNGDAASIRQVLDEGYGVNRLEMEIDHQCNLVLAQRQPEANDLRLILTALKITTDLERTGAQAELIARRAEMLFQRGAITLPRFVDLGHFHGMALDMLDKSLEAFNRSDAALAGEVIRQDKLVNEEYEFIARNLVGRMLEDPRAISSALDFLFISKAIERIGDHAKNVAAYVIFMVKGVDVRHTPVDELGSKNC